MVCCPEFGCQTASLDYISSNGGRIYNAWSSYKWAGDAAVHVSIVNWEKGNSELSLELDGSKVPVISTRLTAEQTTLSPQKLNLSCPKLGFIGVFPRFDGFVLEQSEALELIKKDARNQEVIRPFLVARALQSKPHAQFDRYIIDFDDMSQEEAEEYPEVLQIVRERVMPKRKSLKDAAYNRSSKLYWWRFHNHRPKMRSQLSKLDSYIAVAAHAKEPHFTFIDSRVLPDHGVIAIASSDLYLLGILSSRLSPLTLFDGGFLTDNGVSVRMSATT